MIIYDIALTGFIIANEMVEGSVSGMEMTRNGRQGRSRISIRVYIPMLTNCSALHPNMPEIS